MDAGKEAGGRGTGTSAGRVARIWNQEEGC